jgi:hypothetical protein
MKTLFVLPVFFLILFFIGCQENPITEPVAERSSPILSKEGMINLCCDVTDPFLSGECSVVGTLYYIHEVRYSNNSVYATIGLTIDVDAQLCPKDPQFSFVSWSITKGSTHSFVVKNLQSLNTTFKGESEKQFTELYTISNRKDLMLEIQFLVDLNDLKITSIRTVKVLPSLLTAE